MKNNRIVSKEIASLEAEIADLKNQLSLLKSSSDKTIRQAYMEVEEYFYTITHELKAPIREIALYARFIEEDSGELLLAESIEDLNSIKEICNKAVDMVSKFMEYAKANKKVINKTLISLTPLIKDCIEHANNESNLDIEIDISSLPDIIADVFLIRMMVFNIVSNSIKFTQGVKNPRIRIYSYEENDYACFCFEDNGVGFEMKYASGVFDMFERLHNENDFNGYGIGLATVRKIVERLDGSVEILGSVDRGCVVTVKFPKSMIKSKKEVLKTNAKKKNKIIMGVVGALSGDYAVIAPCRKLAYELAVEEINANGGILGKQIEFLFRDFKSDISLCTEIAWELMELEQADVIMGGQLSSAREEIRKVVHKTKTPYFFNALYEGGLADHYTFCTSAMPEQNLYPMLKYLLEKYGKKCYIITADYNYGILTAESAKHYIEKLGGEIAAIEYFHVSKSNFDVVIDNINDVKPDVIMSFCVSNNQNNFYKQWYEKGKGNIPIVSTIGIGLSSLHKTYAAPIMNNTYFMSSYIEELQSESAKAFTKKLRDKYSFEQVPYIEFDAESAYTAVYLYKAAVEKANSTETEEVIKALESGEIFFDGPGGRVTMRGEDHHTIRDMNLFRVNEENKIETLKSYQNMHSDFIENVIEESIGVKGGIRSCGIYAPNIQYNFMFHRVLQEPHRFMP